MTLTVKVSSRLESWLGLATPDTRADGLTWYHRVNVYAGELADEFDIPLAVAAGVIAALSPACSWEVNRAQAREMLQVYADGQPRRRFVGSTYPPQIRKAWEIRRLIDPADEVDMSDLLADIKAILGDGAFKTRAFFDNIISPTTSRAVTIDRHMLAALDCERRFSRWPGYGELASITVEFADRRGLAPHQLQAIVWCTYKHLQEAQTEYLPF